MKTRILIALSVLWLTVGFVACRTDTQPPPAPGTNIFHLPTGEIVRPVIISFVENPHLDLRAQLLEAGAIMVDGKTFRFAAVDDAKKRAACDAAAVAGATFYYNLK